MDDKNLSIETFHEQLQQWTGNKIVIYKYEYELEDEDETIMKLQDVTYEKDTHRLDDYQPKYTLQLNGTGEVENASHDLEPLPSSVYEIPLGDGSHYQFNGEKFILTTDRGKYTIEKKDK